MVESRLFNESNIENGLHHPKFDLYGMSELPPAVCQTVCASSLPSIRPSAGAGHSVDVQRQRHRASHHSR